MAPIGQTAFSILLWGTLLAVFVVFCYEVYVLRRDVSGAR